MVVCEVKPHKENTNRTHITVAGSQNFYPRDLGKSTGALNLFKFIINSALLRRNAHFFWFDLKNFYLQTPIERSEYVFIKLSDIPQ